MRKVIIINIISGLYILLFTYAAISKITDYHKFKIQLSQSPLLTSFATKVAWSVPMVEIAIVVLFVTEKLRRPALFISIGLMSMFTSYIIFITNYSTYIPCSCGGVLQNMSWNQHLVFNLLFLIMGIAALLIDSPETRAAIQGNAQRNNIQNDKQEFSL